MVKKRTNTKDNDTKDNGLSDFEKEFGVNEKDLPDYIDVGNDYQMSKEDLLEFYNSHRFLPENDNHISFSELPSSHQVLQHLKKIFYGKSDYSIKVPSSLKPLLNGSGSAFDNLLKVVIHSSLNYSGQSVLYALHSYLSDLIKGDVEPVKSSLSDITDIISLLYQSGLMDDFIKSVILPNSIHSYLDELDFKSGAGEE
jgi:hypothetical protein